MREMLSMKKIEIDALERVSGAVPAA